MLTNQARRFGDALVDRHIVSRDMVESALDEAAHTGEPFPDVIARHAELPSADLASAWAAALAVAYVDFATDVVHPEAVSLQEHAEAALAAGYQMTPGEMVMLTVRAMWKIARNSVAVSPASSAMRRRFASSALTNSAAAAGNPSRV